MNAIIQWLLDGDPSIRWQVQRDLLDAPPAVYARERAKVATAGWGARILAHQAADGNWGGGLYTPKWISTTYTLLSLRELGLPQDNSQTQRGCQNLLARGLERDGGINLFRSLEYSETCVNGMLLSLLSYFRCNDRRVESVLRYLLREQMPDGGWNCQRLRGATHSSFHTTISVLEGLREYRSYDGQSPVAVSRAMRRGQEFLLRHRLYKSHRSGKVVKPEMTRMYFPPRWHYDFLRGLDYFQSVGADRDARITDAIELLESKRLRDARWPLNKPWSGRVFFQMEAADKPSRWITLRALRIQKWWYS